MSNIVHIGPRTQAADRLHGQKHRGIGEDFREAMNRLAFTLKDNDQHYHDIRSVISPMRFLFGGRIQSAIGAIRQVTSYNCFVSGTIEDSYVDGSGSIMHRAHEAAATMRMGGGIGYDFSTLRPRGDSIRRLQSHSTGPVSFMRIFNEICLCTSSSGHRRGAQMALLRVDHPDIEEYIRAKQNIDQFLGFNLSIAITNEFMEAALNGKSFDLRFDGQIYRTVDASALWESIMRSTHDWSEPGVIFMDRINETNNLWYCETISATNPCAEQPLPPFGACLLGSFNLPQYLVPRNTPHTINEAKWELDLDLLRHDIPIITRAMDNVVDRSIYPLPQQRAEAITKRRMGIGVTGLANALEATGHTYGSQSFLNEEGKLIDVIRDEIYTASAHLAAEKGTFPLYDDERYLNGKFVKTLPEHVRYEIKKHGIRNSHLTSIAPTGTISLCADNVSGGLEPVFAYSVQRPINLPTGTIVEEIEDYGAKFLGTYGKLAKDVTAREHIDVLATAQRRVDSAVSKTVNMDSKTMSWNEFKGLYQYAWEQGCKSCSTFNISGQRAGLLIDSDNDGANCTIDLETGRRDCA